MLLPPPWSTRSRTRTNPSTTAATRTSTTRSHEFGHNVRRATDDDHPRNHARRHGTAYPSNAFASDPVVNDTVGGRPVVTVAPGAALVAFDWTVGGRTLTFSSADPRHLRPALSRLRRTTGFAVGGLVAGIQLRPAMTHSRCTSSRGGTSPPTPSYTATRAATETGPAPPDPASHPNLR